MNWFYAKDGQQMGPVAFSEIERLHGEGQLPADALVWQQGTPNWVKLSTVLASPATPPPPQDPAIAPVPSAVPVSPVTAAATTPVPAAPLSDYGDFLCWGFIAVLLPCLGWPLVLIVLIILQLIEYFEVRKAVEEGRLAPSDYSRLHPVLYVIGLFCCGTVLYPVFMHLRNKAGCFKPQPHAVLVAIIVVVLLILEALGGGQINFNT